MKRLLAPCFLAMAIALLWPSSVEAQVVVVNGEITQDTTWTRDNTYVLSGAVFVRAGAALTIEAGTLIVGEFATTGTLVIDQGARIFANGTRRRPIVFTSDQLGEAERGFWGGLVINGNAPINVPGGKGEGEGGTGVYGGSDPDDDSGVLRYVRVEFAGIEFSPDNELNGIAFQGVGRGTTIEYIQVHMNKDDGIEFFGGTANGKYFVITWCGDDSLDWTDGWTGSVQYVVIQQRGDDADQGIEADNNAENNNRSPRSSPTIYNITIIGDPDADEGDESDIGILLREGTSATIRNAVVIGFKEWGIVISQPATWKEARSGSLTVDNSVFFDNGGALGRSVGEKNFSDELGDGETFTTNDFMTGAVNADLADNYVMDPKLKNPYDLAGNPYRDWSPVKSSPLIDGTIPVAAAPGGDTFIEDTDFVGGLKRGARNNWLKGWVKRPAA